MSTPSRLWAKANAEHPDDPEARRARYRELMIEAGHLIPGLPKPLPCGFPTRMDDLLSDEEHAALNADLARMAKQRRDAEAASRDWPMP